MTRILTLSHLKLKLMKKILSLALAVAAVALIASCSSSSSSPGKAAKQYSEYAANGQYDKYLDGFYSSEDTPKAEYEEQRAMLKAMLTEKVTPMIEEKGGIKSIEVVSEEISPDGKTATVGLKTTYGNGDVQEEDTDMILVGGKWMMDMD